MSAVISKGITLSYKNAGDWKVLTDLQEIPDLGGEAEAIEITTLADDAHMYTNGIKSYGDSLPFKFLYAKEQFNELCDITDSVEWKVSLPDTTTCTFSGVASVKLDSVGVNAALTYTLSVKPDSSMAWA